MTHNTELQDTEWTIDKAYQTLNQLETFIEKLGLKAANSDDSYLGYNCGHLIPGKPVPNIDLSACPSCKEAP